MNRGIEGGVASGIGANVDLHGHGLGWSRVKGQTPEVAAPRAHVLLCGECTLGLVAEDALEVAEEEEVEVRKELCVDELEHLDPRVADSGAEAPLDSGS
jgi:hypothetical protein